MSLEQIIQDSYDLLFAYPLKTPTNKPAIYVACLAAYNNGKLHGTWIDCTIGRDYVWKAIRDMLADSPEEGAEEWAIHDHECFGSHNVRECSDINKLCDIAELLDEENGELILEIMSHLGSGTTIEAAREFFEYNYAGTHKDLGEFAYNLAEETGDLTSILKSYVGYIDFDAMGRDMDYSGDIFTIHCGSDMHVFWNR